MDFSEKPLPAFRNDPWNPLLISPTVAQPSVVITLEQEKAIREVLLLASSDSRFAQKAADAIRTIMIKGAAVVPSISTLNPATKVTNSSTFVLRVLGTGYDEFCLVYIQGNPIATTLVSDTEVNVSIDTMGVAPGNLIVTVRNTSTGLISNAKQFSVTATL